MSGTMQTGAKSALALTRDAFVNLLTGDEERALRYLTHQATVIEALLGVIESKGDVRREMALKTAVEASTPRKQPEYRSRTSRPPNGWRIGKRRASRFLRCCPASRWTRRSLTTMALLLWSSTTSRQRLR
jgi:hypothetical protein